MSKKIYIDAFYDQYEDFLAQMQQVIFNQYLDAALCGLFMVVVVSVLVFGIRACMKAYALSHPSSKESAYEALPEQA